jgi:hypothetical protein
MTVLNIMKQSVNRRRRRKKRLVSNWLCQLRRTFLVVISFFAILKYLFNEQKKNGRKRKEND